MEKMNFNLLTEQYRPMIHSIIRRHKIYGCLEEYIQTGLIALWEAAAGFDQQKGNFPSYAYSLINGRILNKLKEEIRFQSRNVLISPDSPYWDTCQSPADQALVKDLLIQYSRFLTHNQRVWFLSAFLSDKNAGQIAAEQGVSIAAVKSWRRSALKRIKKCIETEERE